MSEKLPAPPADALLLAWLTTVLVPMSRSRVKVLLQSGRVFVNGDSVTQFDHRLQPTDIVSVGQRPLLRCTVPILFEDAHLIAVNKPVDMLSVATDEEKIDTAFARLQSHLIARKAGKPYVVHRLDRETSGVLLFARTPTIRDQLQATWDTTTKTYLALVVGTPNPREGTIDDHLLEGRDFRVRKTHPDEDGAKRAISQYRVLAQQGRYSLLEVILVTGRKHQIRVHLAGIACPVIGDTMYGKVGSSIGRLALHAWKLSIVHPVTNEKCEWEAPYPVAMTRAVKFSTTLDRN